MDRCKVFLWDVLPLNCAVDFVPFISILRAYQANPWLEKGLRHTAKDTDLHCFCFPCKIAPTQELSATITGALTYLLPCHP